MSRTGGFVDSPRRLLTTGAVARVLGVSRYTAHRWLRAGLIPGARLVLGRWRVPSGALDRWLGVT